MTPDGNTLPGTRVRLTQDVSAFGQVVARAGETATVKYRPFGPHATMNGGGWDVTLRFDDPGRRFPSFVFDDEGHYVKVEGDYAVDPVGHDFLIVHSSRLEVAS